MAEEEGYEQGAQPGQFAQYVPIPELDQAPVNILCPYCGANVVTTIRREMGTFSWIMVVLLAFFGGYCCLCLIPFFVDSCKDAVHICPNCGKQIGRYKKM
ncbi:hypothetical protein L9F63_003934 [Diploptera punctata]|uniref:LITAF domain-containing protein n=1 Tax=Diploptera punctata TaxID=6984 RepID=A0AAD7ZHF5_DIPPU|nr:hypothetical protein L9F63_003934 [Diploptera punctata]